MKAKFAPLLATLRTGSSVDMFRRPALVLLSLAFFSLAGCSNTAPTPSLANRVDGIVAPLVTANQFSGAIVLSRNGGVVYQRGFGMANQSARIAFTPDTASDGGSLAKTFTAAGIWWLVQEGLVELDAPVAQYVAEYPHKQTTVRQLLSHSNGLPAFYEFFDPYFAKDEVRTTQALLRLVSEHSPSPGFLPGARFEYSNLGFDAAALVIENVTGQSYETFLKERFFTRLGMNNSFARPARLAQWTGVRTLGYRWRDAAWQLFDVFDMEAFLGASNLYFSAADLGRWASANAAGNALPPAAATAGEHRSLIDGKPSAINALSWYCDGTATRCYYTGSINAFHSLVYWDRGRNESVALVSNSAMSPWQVITLQRNLVDALAGRDTRFEGTTHFAEISSDSLPVVTGIYHSETVGVVAVEPTPTGLSLRVENGLKFDMFQVSGEVFYVPGTDYWVAFGGGTPPSSLYLRSMFLDATLSRVPDPTRDKASEQPASASSNPG